MTPEQAAAHLAELTPDRRRRSANGHLMILHGYRRAVVMPDRFRPGMWVYLLADTRKGRKRVPPVYSRPFPSKAEAYQTAYAATHPPGAGA